MRSVLRCVPAQDRSSVHQRTPASARSACDWAIRLPHVRIHAYEPHPATFAMLAENIAANHLLERVICHQKAVGREAGMLTLHTNDQAS